MNLHNAEFVKSAATPQGIIRDGLPQIVFSGKSNVGKSSTINNVLNRKNFARVANTPGKTAHINFFLIDRAAYFVDLPGYGYAKASKGERERWSVLMGDYFSATCHIALGIMIVDSRHKPTRDDEAMADLYKSAGCALVVAANKIDKVKNSEKEANIRRIRDTLDFGGHVAIIPFSAEKGTNRGLLLAEIKKAVDPCGRSPMRSST